MTSLTKTEQILIERAKMYNGTASVETCYGRGSYGGKVCYGARERDAMFKLQAKNLIRIVARTPWQDYNRGYGMGGTVFAYSLI